MKKIVILGCENSHAKTFLGFIKNNPKYNDILVEGVYSHDKEAMTKLTEQFGVKAMNSYDEYVDSVDGVIITARHGDNHYKYAKPYIKNNMVMFIDKPITITEEEAILFMKDCMNHNVRITGGSSCIHEEVVKKIKKEHEDSFDGKTCGGYVRCPISLNNINGGFFFYAQHLVEIVLYTFGKYPLSVKSFLNKDKLTVVFRYEDFDITGLFTDENYSCYYIMRDSQNHVHGEEFNITGESPCFKVEFEEFYKLLNGDSQKTSYNDFISPVFVMNAIKKSIDSGKEEKVNKFVL